VAWILLYVEQSKGKPAMSLSMQISRGALALTLLLFFVLLAAATKPQHSERMGALPVAASIAVCDLPSSHASSWRFAQTPADLGPLARRWDNCRA
jgi:hypothetical protein